MQPLRHSDADVITSSRRSEAPDYACLNESQRYKQPAEGPHYSALADEARGFGRAHAKIILFGEHAVVFGEPAIAFPMQCLTLRATAEPCDGELWLTANNYDGPLADAPTFLSPVGATIKACLDLLEYPQSGMHISCQGNVPPARGLGSSAAASAAMVDSIIDFSGKDVDYHSRYELVQIGERVAHGSASGLDAHTVLNTHPVLFQGGRSEPITVSLGSPLVVADTGQPGDTLSAVRGVDEIRRTHKKRFTRNVDAIRHHTVEARIDLALDDRASLGERMNAVHEHLADLGVSSPELENLISAARNEGALGAKLTGGGRGGCIIALSKDENHAIALSDALRAAGARRTWLMHPSEFQR